MPKFARPNTYTGKQANQQWTGQTRFANSVEALAGDSDELAISPLTLSQAATGFVPAATTLVAGKVFLATNAETVTGTNTTKAVTPDDVTARLAAPGPIGGTTPAAATFTSLTATGTVNLNATGSGVTTIGTGGTGATNIGNATGNTSVTGSLTASGDVVLSSVATKISMNGGAATDFIGTGTLVNGTVTIANTNIAAADRILISRISTGAGSTTLGILTYTISAATNFVVESRIVGTPGSVQTGDQSTFSYVIFRQT